MIFKTAALVFIGFCSVAQAQSVQRAIDFNLQDSRSWSAQLQKVDLTTLKDFQGKHFAIMRFQSADSSFQIDCLRQGESPVAPDTIASCHIQTDSSKSKSGVTRFRETADGRMQEVTFQNPEDLKKLKTLVASEYQDRYVTKQQETVKIGNQTLQIPLLTTECSSAQNCKVTIVGGSAASHE